MGCSLVGAINMAYLCSRSFLLLVFVRRGVEQIQFSGTLVQYSDTHVEYSNPVVQYIDSRVQYSDTVHQYTDT